MSDFLSPTAHEPRPRSDAAAHPVASSLNDPVARTISPDTETSKQLTALGSSVIRVPFPCVARWPNPKDAVTLVRAEHQVSTCRQYAVTRSLQRLLYGRKAESLSATYSVYSHTLILFVFILPVPLPRRTLFMYTMSRTKYSRPRRLPK
jgi:hypothetical protein